MQLYLFENNFTKEQDAVMTENGLSRAADVFEEWFAESYQARALKSQAQCILGNYEALTFEQLIKAKEFVEKALKLTKRDERLNGEMHNFLENLSMLLKEKSQNLFCFLGAFPFVDKKSLLYVGPMTRYPHTILNRKKELGRFNRVI